MNKARIEKFAESLYGQADVRIDFDDGNKIVYTRTFGGFGNPVKYVLVRKEGTLERVA